MNNYKSYHLPISVKGIVGFGNRILLLKNEREEWELPGGKLEIGEKVEECLARELKEETNLDIKINKPIHNWVYTVFPNVHVLIVTYSCFEPTSDQFKISDEHKEGRWFGLDEIKGLAMPQGYKDSIELHCQMKSLANLGSKCKVNEDKIRYD